MKKHLLFIVCVAITATLSFAQVIPNGGFETWTSTTFDAPTGYGTSNLDCWPLFGVENATQVTDAQNGTYAIKLETKISGGDTALAYFYEGDPTKTKGGIPYAEKPTSLTGYYKGTFQTGDSGGVWVIFKKSGSVIFNKFYWIGTSTGTYTQFTIPINLSVTADTLIFAAISSYYTNQTYAKNGTFVLFDNLSFNGVGSQPVGFNGSLETWTQTVTEDPASWQTSNFDLSRDGGMGNATKTTDKYAGTYALQLVTAKSSNGNYISTNITNGNWGNSGGQTHGGIPYTGTNDSLMFYYKYTAVGSDSGSVSVNLSKNGSSFAVAGIQLPATSTYKLAKIPIITSMTPDTLRIDISSSRWPYDNSNLGSTLKIDDLKLKSMVGVRELFSKKYETISVYPNPANQVLNINYNSNKAEVTVSVYDVLGNKVQSLNVNGTQLSNYKLDISTLDAGAYFVEVVDGTIRMTTQFTVAK